MSAGKAEVAAAAAAVQAAQQLAHQYHQAAGANPGLGYPVALPAPATVKGEGYGLAGNVDALRPVQHTAPAPVYATAPVGGISHAGTPDELSLLDGVSWPTRMANTSMPSVLYVSAGTGKATLRSRLRAALAGLLGRS